MKMSVNIHFYKVIVLSVGIIETVIVDERHFANREAADAYIGTLAKGLIGIKVKM